jgi:hypothetical protein
MCMYFQPPSLFCKEKDALILSCSCVRPPIAHILNHLTDFNDTWYEHCASDDHKKVKLSLCLTKHYAMKTYWGSGSIAPHILNLGIRWRWVINLMPQPLYLRGKNPQYSLDKRLGGLPRVGLDPVAKRIPIIAPVRNLTPVVQPVA